MLTGITLLLSFTVHSSPGPGLTVSVSTDRAAAIYRCGEAAYFTVSVTRGETPVTDGEVAYRLSLDGATTYCQGQLPLGPTPSVIAYSLRKPGVLRCDVSYPADGQTLHGAAAAAFDPELIQPTAVEPPDFMRFWDARKRELAAVPLDIRLTRKDELCDAEVDVWKFSLGNIGGSRVYGMMAAPNAPGAYPAIMALPWGGVYGIGAGSVKPYARQGFLAVEFGGHDHDIDLPEQFYRDEYAGPLRGYQLIGAESPRRTYLLRIVMSCLRVIDWLVTRPEWDGEHIILTGSSQAAGLCIVTAGLDHRVSAIAATVPVLAEHTGRAHGRPSGWPGFYGDPRRERTGRYYDAVNFARYIECPVLMGVGLLDTLCPPMTVYSAYNVIRSPKRMVVGPTAGHESIAAFYEAREPWIREQAGRKQREDR